MNRCFITQYIGNVDTLETLDFLESSINHLSSMLGDLSYSSIGLDLHPQFLSSRLAEKYSKLNNNAPLYKCQHHHAHAVSLMVDNNLSLEEEIVSIVADGVGYGDDGNIWGGEILHTNYTDYERIGHFHDTQAG